MSYSIGFRETVLTSIQEGMSKKEASRVYKVNLSTIKEWCRLTNTDSGKKKQRRQYYDLEEKYQVIKEAQLGASVLELSRKYNLSEQTVKNWISLTDRIVALYSVQGINKGTEETVTMPRSTDVRDIKLQNRSLKEENDFLRAKVAYLEELMKLSNIPAGNFKKKLVMKPLTEQLKEKQEQ